MNINIIIFARIFGSISSAKSLPKNLHFTFRWCGSIVPRQDDDDNFGEFSKFDILSEHRFCVFIVHAGAFVCKSSSASRTTGSSGQLHIFLAVLKFSKSKNSQPLLFYQKKVSVAWILKFCFFFLNKPTKRKKNDFSNKRIKKRLLIFFGRHNCRSSP